MRSSRPRTAWLSADRETPTVLSATRLTCSDGVGAMTSCCTRDLASGPPRSTILRHARLA